MARARKSKTPFYRFNSSPEIIRLVVMMYVKFPLSLRNVEDLLAERGIDICHETVRFLVMEWTTPDGIRCARLRLLDTQTKGAVRGPDYQNWNGHVEDCFSASWCERR